MVLLSRSPGKGFVWVVQASPPPRTKNHKSRGNFSEKKTSSLVLRFSTASRMGIGNDAGEIRLCGLLTDKKIAERTDAKPCNR